jgi:hypothetical protein
LFVDFNQIEKRVNSFGSGLYSANFIIGLAIFRKAEHNNFFECIGIVEQMQRTTINFKTGTCILVFR